MNLTPDFKDFARAYENGQDQVLWQQLPADLDTPVSIMLKLSNAGPDSFLLESVTGGEARARFSVMGTEKQAVFLFSIPRFS